MIKIGFGLPFTILLPELISINKQMINYRSREQSLLQIFLFLAKYFGPAKLLLHVSFTYVRICAASLRKIIYTIERNVSGARSI